MNEAVGYLEVYGLTAAFIAADAACKAGNVRIEAFDNNKPQNADKLPVPLLMIIKLRGRVEDVRLAVEAAVEAANEITGVATSYVSSRAEEETEKLLKINCLNKK